MIVLEYRLIIVKFREWRTCVYHVKVVDAWMTNIMTKASNDESKHVSGSKDSMQSVPVCTMPTKFGNLPWLVIRKKADASNNVISCLQDINGVQKVVVRIAGVVGTSNSQNEPVQ